VIGTDAHFSPSDEDSGDTGGKIIESAEASRGMCHYHDGVGSLVMSTSFEEGPEGHDTRRFHH